MLYIFNKRFHSHPWSLSDSIRVRLQRPFGCNYLISIRIILEKKHFLQNSHSVTLNRPIGQREPFQREKALIFSGLLAGDATFQDHVIRSEADSHYKRFIKQFRPVLPCGQFSVNRSYSS